MPEFIAQVDVREEEFQNPQEFASEWGEITEEIERLGGDVLSTYAVLGDFDFQVAYDVDDSDVAFKVSQVLEGRGFDTETMRAFRVDRLGELVDDV